MSEASQKYGYGWVTDPPMIELAAGDSTSGATMQYYAGLLSADITAWSKDLAPPLVGKAGEGVPKPNTIGRALVMCAELVSYRLGINEVVFVYPLAGRPVGILVLSPRLGDADGVECGYVCDLVVHPGVDFGGAIMLEFALNYLRKNGILQALQLCALDDSEELLGAYAGFGFVQVGSSKKELQLVAAKSAKWGLRESGWRYKSSRPMGPLYAATKGA